MTREEDGEWDNVEFYLERNLGFLPDELVPPDSVLDPLPDSSPFFSL